MSAGPTSSPSIPGSLPPCAPEASASAGMTRPDLLSRTRLNPAFVNWLMGLPPLWTNIEATSCDAAETALYRCRLQLCLSSFFDASDSRGNAA